MKKLNIKTKLILGIICSIFLFGLLAAGAAFYITKEYILTSEKKDFLEITYLHKEKVKYLFQETETLAEQVAKQDQIISYLIEPERANQDVSVLNVLKSYNVGDKYSAIYLMDVNGNTLASTAESFVGQNYGFREYFKQAVSGQNYIDVAIGVTSKKLGYYFSVPVYSDGRIVGVVVMKQKMESLIAVFNEGRHHHEHNIYFLEDNGVIIGSNDYDSLYFSFGDLTKEEIDNIKQEKRFADMEIDSLRVNEVKEILDRCNLNCYEPVNIQLNSTVYTLSRIDSTQFYFVLEHDIQMVSDLGRSVGVLIASVIFMMAFLAAMIIYVMMINFLKPITIIDKAMRSFSGGNCLSKVKVKTGDEFESIANAYNNMAQEICENQKKLALKSKELEKKVADLEKVNKYMIGREKKMAELKMRVKDKEQ